MVRWTKQTYLLDTERWDEDSAFVNCMICEKSIIVRVENIVRLGKREKGIAVHRGCFHKAVKIHGKGEVIEH